jgi:hypothetical protein
MSEPRIDVEWWPPAREERIGDERARELITARWVIAGPRLDEPRLISANWPNWAPR